MPVSISPLLVLQIRQRLFLVKNNRGERRVWADLKWRREWEREQGIFGQEKKKRNGRKKMKKKDVCWVWVRESDRSPGWFRSAIRAPLLSVRFAVCVCVCVCGDAFSGCLCAACVTVVFARRLVCAEVVCEGLRGGVGGWGWLHERVWIRLSC